MAKNRMVYALWLLATGCLYIFGNDLGTRVILYASVLIPVVMVILAAIASRRVRLSLAVADGIQIQTSGFLLGYIRCIMRRHNAFTGEINDESIILSLGKHGVIFEPIHCGMYRFAIARSVAVDMFGLSKWQIKEQAQAEWLVLPKRYEIEVVINPSADITGESDEYSAYRPGDDPNDTFGIREYIPGDPLRRIHWKLSNKTGKLLIREWGLPVAKNILVLFETAAQDDNHANQMANEAYSICHALLENNHSHDIGWYEEEKYQYHNINNEADLPIAFARLLENNINAASQTSANRETNVVLGYSQVIVVGAHA